MAKSTSQKVTAAQEWKNRMAQARADLPEGIGQQNVLERVCEIAPELDTLTNLTRWHNAWHGRVADVAITTAVEKAVAWFVDEAKPRKNLLKRQRLQRPQ